jgi:hypothetical protein
VKGLPAILLVACAALPTASFAAARFAVIAGNNVGGAGRAKLWYAERDAERFAGALRELGDFTPERVTLLQAATAGELRAALEAVEVRVAAARKAGERALLIVYFSGHAGPGGLELGDQRIAYAELREFFARSSADTKVGIVDACEAGELTQVKGAHAVANVDFALPLDDTVQGTAFIASTAVGEAAQESAAIGGSFFTHHLEIALRGAGDSDGDGRVTLAEAFRYTAARTVAGTASTKAGPQHPTYDFRMAGRGDVVLADLRRAEASLKLPADSDALYVVRGPGELLAEVAASAEGTTLALPAGHYKIERRSGDGIASTSVTLDRGETRALPPLRPSVYELARSKGGPAPLLAFFGGGVASFPLPGVGIAPLLRAGVRQEVGSLGLRAHLDYSRRDATDLTLRYAFSYLGGGVALLAPISLGRVLLELGPDAGAGMVVQQLEAGKSFSAPDLNASLAAVVSFRTGPLRFALDAAAGVHAFKLDGKATVRPAGSLALLLVMGL